jgi:CRISPR/Cas system-associated exonuclease Cas4 (RecB family)
VDAIQLVAAAIAVIVLAYLFVVSMGRRLGSLGRIVYEDDGNAPTLRNEAHRIFGKPDQVVKPLFGGYTPVEVKSHALRGDRPRTSHVVQLMAQGLLVEGKWGKYPRIGYLLYDGRKPMRVKLGRRARKRIIKLLDARRSTRPWPTTEPINERCKACPVLPSCRFHGAPN